MGYQMNSDAIPALNSGEFTWQRWRAGSPVDLMVVCREACLIQNGAMLRRFAVGYCDGISSACRQKLNNKCVMFFKDGKYFWFHLTDREFEEVFNEAR